MSKRNLLLHLLLKAKQEGRRGLTTRELVLAGCGSRFGARLKELREQGHVVRVDPLNVSEGEYLYSYVSGPEAVGSVNSAASGAERNVTAADSGAGTPSSPSVSTSVLATTLAAPSLLGATSQCALDDDWDWNAAA